MQIPGRYCVLVSVCSVIELYVLRIMVGFWVMDVASILKFLNKASETGFGFFLRGSFFRVLNGLAMLLIFMLCMKFLHFGWRFKGLMRFLSEFGSKPRNGFCFKDGVVEVCASMITHLKCSPLESSLNPNVNKNKSISGKENAKSNDDADTYFDISEEKHDNESEVHDEDQEIDVITLRKLVKTERKRADSAYAELERERRASATATEEAMAMILRLQSEKSSVEMEANQFRRIAEKKQQYAQEVIESLQWIIMQNESQISLLEDKLMLHREKMRQYVNEDEMEQFEEPHGDDDAHKAFPDFSVDDDQYDPLIS
ncbi:protein FLOURY 1-like [Neltuma alba]|uniref:protein FLOURY 1-like n=1 Tax=Neltuma alba TaxID=207710 RepID=UPI0010A4E357|nr:protein FLOURY 1-like [Prosopis alba]